MLIKSSNQVSYIIDYHVIGFSQSENVVAIIRNSCHPCSYIPQYLCLIFGNS